MSQCQVDANAADGRGCPPLLHAASALMQLYAAMKLLPTHGMLECIVGDIVCHAALSLAALSFHCALSFADACLSALSFGALSFHCALSFACSCFEVVFKCACSLSFGAVSFHCALSFLITSYFYILYFLDGDGFV